MDWSLLAKLVGLVLAFSTLAKAVEAGEFARHIGRIGLLPRPLLGAAAVLVVALEAAWSAALLLDQAPEWVWPATPVLLTLLAAVSLWGWRAGRITECGCYGSWIVLSPPVSAAVNVVMSGLVGLAWLRAGPLQSGPAGWLLPLAATALMAACAWLSLWRGPLLRRGPIRTGRPWDEAWLPGVNVDGERLVVFLHPGCRFCAVWAKALAGLRTEASLPPVLAVIADDEGAEALALPGFDSLILPGARLRELMPRTPAAVMVAGGIVGDVFFGRLPPTFVRALRERKQRLAQAANEAPHGQGPISG